VAGDAENRHLRLERNRRLGAEAFRRGLAHARQFADDGEMLEVERVIIRVKAFEFAHGANHFLRQGFALQKAQRNQKTAFAQNQALDAIRHGHGATGHIHDLARLGRRRQQHHQSDQQFFHGFSQWNVRGEELGVRWSTVRNALSENPHGAIRNAH